MRKVACSIPSLGYATSYIQVEFGIKNLSDLWAIYIEASEDGGDTFKTKKAICEEFGTALNDLYDITEPPPYKMGLTLDKAG
jgi:hypothetical protein